MMEALHRHHRLLRDYYAKAFNDGNLDYPGEVAG
jgi:hypothetical protein